jgi:predicted aminopeptidase
MDYIKSVWLLVAFACLMLLIMSGCVNLKYYNSSGEVDAEIIIRPSEDAIGNAIDSGEIESGIEAQIAIPISTTD